jgi:hypothetical protein
VPCLSLNQVNIGLGDGLIDFPTNDPHLEFWIIFEWSRLNPSPEAVDYPFKYPTLANWALGTSRKGIDEMITHLRSIGHQFQFPS